MKTLQEAIKAITALTTELGTLKATVGTFRTVIGTLKAKLGTVEAKLGTVEAENKELKAKVVTLEGDNKDLWAHVEEQDEKIEHLGNRVTFTEQLCAGFKGMGRMFFRGENKEAKALMDTMYHEAINYKPVNHTSEEITADQMRASLQTINTDSIH